MYESPIDIIYGEIETQFENDVLKAVQRVGVNVNKEELLKALQYDREQYSKGYADCLNADRWIPFTLRECDEEEREAFNSDYALSCKLPDEDEEIFVTYRLKDEFYVGTDTFMRDGSECYLDSGSEFVTEAIAWKPLPEPYKGE